MLTQWQTWVVCTSLPSDAQALTQPGNHTMICQKGHIKLKIKHIGHTQIHQYIK